MSEENWIVIGDFYDEASDSWFEVEAKVKEDVEPKAPELYLKFKVRFDEQCVEVKKCIWIAEPTLLKLMCETLEERTRKLNEEVVKDADRNRKNKSSTI